MRKARMDPRRVWEDIADHFVPNLAVRTMDVVVYFYLLRITRMKGVRTLLVPAAELARRALFTSYSVRRALHRLASKGAVRILNRSHRGLRLTVKLPSEIPGCVRRSRRSAGPDLEIVNFFASPKFRSAIYRRDHDRCFYCLRLLSKNGRSLDHVVPIFRGGNNSYRNLVTCCPDCNMLKNNRPAAEFLRRLHRNAQLNSSQLKSRLAALKALAKGKLKPVMNSVASDERLS